MNIDNKIIKGCIDKDRLAQKELFEKYGKFVYTVIYRMINEYETAHDLLQESFIEIFRDIQNLKTSSSLMGWMKTIAIRKTIRYLKTRKTFDEINEEKMCESIEWKEEFTAEYLDKAIKGLPNCTRTVFLLIEAEGYKHKEVAKMLNISEGTSKSQLNYAKKLLRIKLKELYQ